MTLESEHPDIRHRDEIASEITKIISHPATVLILAITLVVNLALAVIDASGLQFYTGNAIVPSRLSSFGMVMLAPLYAFLVIPVWAAATEHHGGQLRMSLVATPRRGAFAFAKLTATVVVCFAATLIAIVPARLVIGISAGSSPSDLALNSAQWVAVYLLMSLIAFGLAGILKGTIAPLAIMIALPIVVATGILQWPDGIRFLPDQASLSLVGTPGYDVTELPPGIAVLVLLAWALLSVVVYTVTLIRRDA